MCLWQNIRDLCVGSCYLRASDNAIADQENQGLLKREGVIRSDQLAFLDIRKWQDDKYATVEHVAPESNSRWWTGTRKSTDVHILVIR